MACTMTIILDGVDGCFKELKVEQIIHLRDDVITVAVLPDGMQSGRPSVAMMFRLPNGDTVIAETSARLFCTAARAIMSRYPHLFED